MQVDKARGIILTNRACGRGGADWRYICNQPGLPFRVQTHYQVSPAVISFMVQALVSLRQVEGWHQASTRALMQVT